MIRITPSNNTVRAGRTSDIAVGKIQHVAVSCQKGIFLPPPHSAQCHASSLKQKKDRNNERRNARETEFMPVQK